MTLTLSTARTAAFALSLFALSGLAVPGQGHAADPKPLGSFKDWYAFAYDENGGKVCYMVSRPKKADPAAKQRGDTYVLITHRPKDKTFDVFSVTAGSPYKKDSKVQLQIDKQKFELFTKDDAAWAADQADRKIVDTLLKGSGLTVKVTSAR